MQFGCFVQLEGVRGRHEGLVHVSQVGNNMYRTVCTVFMCMYMYMSFSVLGQWSS